MIHRWRIRASSPECILFGPTGLLDTDEDVGAEYARRVRLRVGDRLILMGFRIRHMDIQTLLTDTRTHRTDIRALLTDTPTLLTDTQTVLTVIRTRLMAIPTHLTDIRIVRMVTQTEVTVIPLPQLII